MNTTISRVPGGQRPAPREGLTWHAQPAEETLTALDTVVEGLSRGEAERRLREHGPNRLPRGEKETLLRRFLRQFHNVLIYVLLTAGGLAVLVGEWSDTVVILGVVVIIAVTGFIQEGRAEKALESIRAMLSLQAAVRREGERQKIQAEELVPGDIVLLTAGDRVPADLRLLQVQEAHVEEAALTGESEPVVKGTETVEAEAPLGDRTCLAFSGTTVVSGDLEGVVIATGGETEIGRIGRMVAEVERLDTPLMRRLNRFGRWLSAVIVLLSIGVFLFGLAFRPLGAGMLLMIVVSLAVAAIPEGLPAVMTITLAKGVQRMARRNAIIRRLPAVETLGSVTVICSDKTGTLTRNEMTVRRVVTAEGHCTVSGTGYRPQGSFRCGDREIAPEETPLLLEAARTGLLSSDAEFRPGEEGEEILHGDPTEGAVVTLARKAGLERGAEERRYPRLAVLPFKSERGFMATLNGTPDGASVVFLKGAPERVLALCDRQRARQGEEPLAGDFWQERIEEAAAGGERLLALAMRQEDEGKERLEPADVEGGGFTLLGLLGLIDPPREEAIEAIRKCREAGIRVCMITGDHALTAGAIAADLGIGDGHDPVTGPDLERASDDELREIVRDRAVFARTSPEHKIRLVKALQANGEIVAMTGDGVNDAPALKRAEVGIAMGIKGTEAAKDASAMVLADDNFASIERAVEEGRTVYDNLRKAILFLLPTNGAQALVILSAVLFGFSRIPVTPLQALWINLVTAVTLGLALAFEPAEGDIMRRPPRRQEEPILSPLMIWRIVFVTFLVAAAALGFFLLETAAGAPVERTRTLTVNVLAAGQLFYLFNSRFILASSLPPHGFTGNRHAWLAAGAMAVLQALFTYFPPFQRWFGTAGLAPADWLKVLAAGVGIYLLVELEKGLVRRFRRPA